MLHQSKKMVDYKLYITKKSKSPDYLFKIFSKIKENQHYLNSIQLPHQNNKNTSIKNNHNINNNLSKDQQIHNIIKKQLAVKRVQKILKTPKQNHVSQPTPCKKKQWISPIAEESKKNVLPFHGIQITKNKPNNYTRQQNIEKILKVLDMNKKLKFFGQYLETQFDGKQRHIISQARANKQSKLSYLTKKFDKLDKGQTNKLCILGQVKKNQLKLSNSLYNNPLSKDQFYLKMMRRKDDNLMQILIESLSISGHFSLTSYIKFYDIFVWQQAPKKQLQQFVANILMGQSSKTSLINDISERIKYFCSKINLTQISQALQGFQQVVKKLIFAQDYENASKQKYYLTRQALIQSLKKNEECISIFINVFYDD